MAKCQWRGVALLGVSARIQDILSCRSYCSSSCQTPSLLQLWIVGPFRESLVLDLEISEYGRPRFLPSFPLNFFHFPLSVRLVALLPSHLCESMQLAKLYSGSQCLHQNGASNNLESVLGSMNAKSTKRHQRTKPQQTNTITTL